MTVGRLVIRGLTHYWPQHLAVAAGVAVGTAVITGALLVGDSVRASLKEVALQRIGRVQVAVPAGDRFFSETLVAAVDAELDEPVAAVLRLGGVASLPDGSARANAVQTLGVTDAFWPLMPTPPSPPGLDRRRVAINRPLADQLGIGTIDPDEPPTVLLRVDDPTGLPRDMPLASAADTTATLRADVVAVIDDHAGGRFTLRAEQVAPLTAYVELSALQRRLDLDGRANLLLVGRTALSRDRPERVNADAVAAAVARHWSPEDASLRLTRDGEHAWLDTPQYFLPPGIDPVAGLGQRALTYFVIEARYGDAATPYSTVAGLDDALLDELGVDALADDGIVINTWLREDLGVGVGDDITLRYWVLEPGRRLGEAERTFTVAAVVPIEGLAAEPRLMPEVEGVTDADSAREWDDTLPIDLDRIRDKDEAYWDAHRGTPKAYVTLPAAQAMWGSRFGELTAVRLPADAADDPAALTAKLDPAAFGLRAIDVRGPALAATTEGIDFGGLFLGLSMFLLAAAAVLTALVFAFQAEQRTAQLGLLLATGWGRWRVRGVLLAEGLIVAAAGAGVGVAAGIGYTAGVLRGLASVWAGAVAGQAVTLHIEPATLATGGLSGVLLAGLAMAWAVRKVGKAKSGGVRAALTGEVARGGGDAPKHRPWVSLAGGVVLVVGGAVACGAVEPGGGMAAAGTFFGLGAAMLVGMLLLLRAGLAWVALRRSGTVAGLGGLAVRNTTRRRGRSLATAAVLACGVFLLAAVMGFRLDTPDDPTIARSGTGGFTLYAQATAPVLHDLNTPAGRAAVGLDDGALDGVEVVGLRLVEGDDASCLNLNRAQSPRLLGVDPRAMASRDAFRFQQGSWAALSEPTEPGVIPAVADANSAQWALGMMVGDTLPFVDERGWAFKVKLVATLDNSILQGALILPERALAERYPSTAGERVLLIACPPGRAEAVSAAVSKQLADQGLAVTPTLDRLAAFNRVQNTYLLIFQALGGLGLALGSVGLLVVVLRNALERRRELAAMRAVGFARGRLRAMLGLEHAALLAVGLVVGLIPAVAAAWPAMRHRGGSVLWPAVAVAAVVLALGLVWVAAAAWAALRGPLLDPLRHE